MIRKVSLTLRSILSRLLEVPSFRRYDAVFVQRQALFVGGPFIERLAKALGARLVFDFDDAIWINDASAFNRRFSWLKNPSKVPRIIKMADLVIAGNPYLADFALQWNANAVIVPTTIDTDAYLPREPRHVEGPVTIGWSGSFSTIEHFKTVLPVLRRIRTKYGDGVRFVVIGDGSYRDDDLGISGMPWRAATEIEDLHRIDIGLMPLPNDEWALGKCGLKALQYMALGIPTVASPIGVNSTIIQDGKNGFLATTDEDWIGVLSTLIENGSLRAEIGAAGRGRVVEAYSVAAWRDKFCDLLLECGSAR